MVGSCRAAAGRVGEFAAAFSLSELWDGMRRDGREGLQIRRAEKPKNHRGHVSRDADGAGQHLQALDLREKLGQQQRLGREYLSFRRDR